MGKPLALKVGVEPTPTTYRDTDRLPPEDLRILPNYSRQSPAIYHLVKSRAILGYSVLHNPRLFLKLHLTRKPVLVPVRSCSTSANGHLVSCYVSIWSRTGKHYLGVRQSCRLFPALFTYAAMSIMNLVKAFTADSQSVPCCRVGGGHLHHRIILQSHSVIFFNPLLCQPRGSIVSLVGVAGFEPTNSSVKGCCLTAWLYPRIVPADTG